MILTLLSWILFALVFIAEAGVLPFSATRQFAAGPVVIHGAAVLLMGLRFLIQLQGGLTKGSKQAVEVFALTLIAFFPVLGVVGVCFLWIAVYILGGELREGVYEEYESYIVERQGGGLEATFQTNFLRKFRDEISFEPYVDILRGQDASTKAKVIEKLSQAFLPENLYLLKEAMRDRNPDVRLYAASALMKMETSINEKIQKAMRAAKKGGSPKAYADLGDLYRIYAESRILEKTLTNYYLRLCAEAYRTSLDADTNQLELIEKYGRCLLQLEEYEKAKKLLDHAVRLWPQNASLAFLRDEAYFKLGRYRELGENLEGRSLKDLDENQKEVAAFWTSKN